MAATTETDQALTKKQVAALVGRDVEEILAFKDYGASVVVVTVDGQKLEADKVAQAIDKTGSEIGSETGDETGGETGGDTGKKAGKNAKA